jgi:hypothetical protein
MKPALRDLKWSLKPPLISQQNTRKQHLKSSPVLNQKPATFKLSFEVFYLRPALSFFTGPFVWISIGKSSFLPLWNSALLPLKSWFGSLFLMRRIQSWRYTYIYIYDNNLVLIFLNRGALSTCYWSCHLVMDVFNND